MGTKMRYQLLIVLLLAILVWAMLGGSVGAWIDPPMPDYGAPEVELMADCVVIDRRDTAWVIPAVAQPDRTVIYIELLTVCDGLPPEDTP